MELLKSKDGHKYGQMADGFFEWLETLNDQEQAWLLTADDGYGLPDWFNDPELTQMKLCYPATSRENQTPRFLLLLEVALYFERVIFTSDVIAAAELVEAAKEAR